MPDLPRSRGATNGPIAVALLVSVLLHLPLFFAFYGDWHLGPLEPGAGAIPDLEIELTAADEPEAPASEEPEPQELLATDLPEPVPQPQAESLHEILEIDEAPPVPDQERIAETEREPLEAPETAERFDSIEPESLIADTEPPAAPDETAPVGPEAPYEPPAPPEAVATLAPAQERVLSRRLAREARQLLESRSPERLVTFEQDDREYTVVFKRQPAAGGTGLEYVTVEITADNGGERLQTSLQMKRLAFSHFTQLIDRWDPWVQLHDDEIAGRFHSNSEILLTYDRKVAPRLLGRVSTAEGVQIVAEKGWKPRSKIFMGGLDTRTPRIRLPEVALPRAFSPGNAHADIHVLRKDTLVIFHANGEVECIELPSRAITRHRLGPGRPTYLMGMGEVEIGVRGVVNGSVTVYAPEQIRIQGNLTYAANPGSDPEADDYLGLVSDGTVEIDRAEITGPGDLSVHAAIYARKRFVVRNVGARNGGTLHILGSVSAGSISETEPRYATRTEFDRRFERTRPPGFPETDRYEIDVWDGRWRMAEAQVSRR